MDYIFRWLQLRFLTGQQQALFDGLRPKYFGAPPVGTPDESDNSLLSSQAERSGAERSAFGGVIPGERSSSSVTASGAIGVEGPALRGVATGHHHASDALKDLIDMGDAPSCPVCGAIMTRNGSCYRCMSCGSTSGCS